MLVNNVELKKRTHIGRLFQFTNFKASLREVIIARLQCFIGTIQWIKGLNICAPKIKFRIKASYKRSIEIVVWERCILEKREEIQEARQIKHWRKWREDTVTIEELSDSKNIEQKRSENSHKAVIILVQGEIALDGGEVIKI